MMATWLGVDPGLATLGWAILRDDGSAEPLLLDYGTIVTPKGISTAKRLVEIEGDLITLVKEFRPDGIAVEMPFFGRQIKAAGGVMQALGIVSLVSCRDGDREPVFLHQASWKGHLGNGRATKKEVAEMVKQLFGLTKMPVDDAVDAIGIAYAALCGVRNQID